MRHRKLLLFLLVTAAILLVSSCSSRRDAAIEQEIRSALSDIPKLYLVECDVQKVLILTDEQWYTIGDRKCIIPIEAHVKAGIDLSQQFSLHVEGDNVYVTLPAPFVEIESSRIRHDKVQTMVGILRRNFTQEEITKYSSEGREQIVEALPELGLIESAQRQAEQVISALIRKLGKNPVIVLPEYTISETDGMITIKEVEEE